MKKTALSKNKERIAFVLPSLGAGGAERVVVNLANGLSNDKEVTIIALFKTSSVFEINNKINVFYCWPNEPTSSNAFIAFINNLSNIFKLNKLTKKHNFDILIGFTTSANVLSILVAKLNNIPCIISERANPKLFIPNKFWFILRKHLYKKCNFLVVQSKLSKDFFTKYLDPKKIEVLPNPLSTALQKKRQSIQRENLILSVGRMDNNKNQEMQLRAFSRLKTNDWKMVLVGDGINRQYLENLSKKLNIANEVLFTGNIEDPSIYYNRSKIFIFTSRSEGFPNVLIEAMFFGLSIISTDCESGPAELISDGENGFLIPVDDEDHLVERLKELISNNKLLIDFGKKARLIGARHTLDKIIDNWLSLINKA